jgi:hypothetical protein
MQCRQCGTEIADKALICYRCGTATTEAKYQPAAPRRSSSSGLIASVLGLALLVVFALYMGRVAGGDSSRLASYAAVAIAVILVGLRAYARRRR